MIGILTVNWHGFDITNELISQVQASEYRDLHLVVVNNSLDEKDKFDQHPIEDERITVIHSPENKGFTGGINTGLKLLLPQKEVTHFIIMNNDVELRPDFLSLLLQKGQRTDRIYSPLIYFRDTNLIYNTGGQVKIWLGGTVNLNNHIPVNKLKKTKPDYFSGCVLFISREVIEKVGFLDEMFGTYYEDVDFCYRAKRLGIELEMLWDITARHFHSYSTKGENVYKIYLLNRNQILFARKHLPPLQRILFIAAAIVRGFIFNLKPKRFKFFARGVREGLALNLHTLN